MPCVGARQHPMVASLLILGLIAAFGAWTDAVAQPERPVVFIPGILGSELSDDGRVVWGTRNSLTNFVQLEILPIGAAKKLQPSGLVEAINVLGPFWVIHQYDSLLSTLRRFGFEDDSTNPNLFVFPYDWRQSNFETASEFDQFVLQTPALQSRQFDLIAHSMGGIVARIWLLEHGGTGKVHKVIYLGTPFQGSQNAFGTLSSGWGRFANFVAGGLDTVRRVVLSFPSIYELFPTYDGCCRLGSPVRYQSVNILDPETWYKYDWLPPEYAKGAERAAAFEDGLKRARRLRELMRRDVPGVEQVLFAGDIIATRLYLYVPADNPSWRNWNFRESRGDGTVPVWSAVNNFNTLAGSQPSFVEHATIFADDWVQNKLGRELVSSLPPPVRTEVPGEVVTLAGTVTLDLVRAELEPPVAAPGEQSRLHVSMEFRDSVSRSDVRPEATMRGPAGAQAVSIEEVTTDEDLAARRLVFSGPIVAPEEEGTFQIDVSIPSQGVRSTYLTVSESPLEE